MSEVSSKDVEARQVLTAVSRELRALALMSGQLQSDISEILKDQSGEVSLRIYKLQSLDRITQSVAGIADFMENLAKTAPSAFSLDAATASQSIMMADLSERLSHCEPSECGETAIDETPGEYSLF